MAQKDNYNVILEEMLKLAQVPLNEEEGEEEGDEDEFSMPNIEKEKDKDIDDKESKDDEKSDEPEEELHDEWEKDFRTGSKFKIQVHENYIYVWYRNKRSPKIQIAPKLRPYRNLFSTLFEKILSHVEKVS